MSLFPKKVKYPFKETMSKRQHSPRWPLVAGRKLHPVIVKLYGYNTYLHTQLHCHPVLH